MGNPMTFVLWSCGEVAHDDHTLNRAILLSCYLEAKGLDRNEFRSAFIFKGIFSFHFCCYCQQFTTKRNLGIKVVNLNLQSRVSVCHSRDVGAGILSS